METFDIKERRLKLGLEQKDVAAACGVSEATVSRWERGCIGSIKNTNIDRLAKVLNVSPLDIFNAGENASLTADEAYFIDLYRKANDQARRSAEAVLKAGQQ